MGCNSSFLINNSKGVTMNKEIVYTDKAPGVVGPYSQAVKAGNFLFTAGQIALEPGTGKMLNGDVQTETERVLENLKAVLEAAGTSFDYAVKSTVLLADMADFGAMNEVYGRYLPHQPPARTTYQAGGLPLGAKVEIELIAIIPE
jgi:2-iminobutanoate/2-iminopropanoate deaminase